MSIFVSKWSKHIKKLSLTMFQDKTPLTLFAKQCFLLTPIAVDNLLIYVKNEASIDSAVSRNLDKTLYKTSLIQTKEIVSFFLLDYLFEFRQNDEHLSLITQLGFKQFDEFEEAFLATIHLNKKDAVYEEFYNKQFSFSHTLFFLQMLGLSFEDASKEPILLITEEIKKIFYTHFDQYLPKVIHHCRKHS